MQKPFCAFHTLTVVSQLALITKNTKDGVLDCCVTRSLEQLTVPSVAAEHYVVDPVVVVLHRLYVLLAGVRASVPHADDGVATGGVQLAVVGVQLQGIDAIPVLFLLGVPYHEGNLSSGGLIELVWDSASPFPFGPPGYPFPIGALTCIFLRA